MMPSGAHATLEGIEMSSTSALNDEIEDQRPLIGYLHEVSISNLQHHFRFRQECLELSRNAVGLVRISACHDLLHFRVQP